MDVYATIVNINGGWTLRVYDQGEESYSMPLRTDNAWLLLKALVEMLHNAKQS